MKKKFVFLLCLLVLFLNFSCNRKKNLETENLNLENNNQNQEISQNDNLENSGEIIDEDLNEIEEIINQDESEFPQFTEDFPSNEDSAISDNEKKEDEIIPKTLLDIQNNLKIYEYGKEIFLTSFENNKYEYVQANGKDYFRLFYDENFRLLKKEIWQISDLENSKILKTEEYSYFQDNKNPEKVIILEENKKTQAFYNEEGLISKSINFEAIENHKDKNKKQYVKISEKNWLYDDKNRVIQENTKFFGKSSKSKENNDTLSEKKQVLVYNSLDEKIPPDSEYYENGILINSIKYSSEADYVKETYFENNIIVTSIYKNYVKVSDIYTKDGKVIREKKYEKNF